MGRITWFKGSSFQDLKADNAATYGIKVKIIEIGIEIGGRH